MTKEPHKKIIPNYQGNAAHGFTEGADFNQQPRSPSVTKAIPNGTSAKDIARMLRALPFADRNAGLQETGDLIANLAIERHALLTALRKIRDNYDNVLNGSLKAHDDDMFVLFGSIAKQAIDDNHQAQKGTT